MHILVDSTLLLLDETNSFVSCNFTEIHSVSSVFELILKLEGLLPNAGKNQILSTFCLFTICFTSLGKIE